MNEQQTVRESLPPRCTSIGRREFMGAVGAAALGTTATADTSSPTLWTSVDGPNQPMGEAKGIFPGRVVWMHNPNAATWDGDPERGSWLEDRFTDPVLADQMLSDALRHLTGSASDAAAWTALFQHYNSTHGRGNVGYRAGERLVLKPNLNCSKQHDDSAPGLYNTPQLTKALLRQLVKHGGIKEKDIVVLDASRHGKKPPAVGIPSGAPDGVGAPAAWTPPIVDTRPGSG